MNQPLDFTSTGRQRNAPTPPPVPPQPPKRQASGPGSGLSRRLRLLLAVAVVIGVAFVAFRVVDANRGSTGIAKVDKAKVLADSSTYCQLVGQLEQVATATGASSSRGHYDGAPDSMKALVDQMGVTALDQMVSAANAAQRADVVTVVQAIEQAGAGDPSGVAAPSFAAAAGRVSDYRATICANTADQAGADDVPGAP